MLLFGDRDEETGITLGPPCLRADRGLFSAPLSQAAEILQQGGKFILRERRLQLMTKVQQDVLQTRRAAVVEQTVTLVDSAKRRWIEEPPIALVGETHMECRIRSEFRRGVTVHASA